MKRLLIIAFLCFILSVLLVGWAWAQDSEEGQEEAQTDVTAEQTEEEALDMIPEGPEVMWGDYRYTMAGIAPSSDLDPQSVIMNWFTPSLYDANWSGANYVHLRIYVEWLTNDRSLDYMPLQLVLVNGGHRYILFGKGCSNASYIWRRGNHYFHDLGCRYPDHVGDYAKLIFTFDTNGAAIDPNTAYIEVKGMLEVWDWKLQSQLYDEHVNPFRARQSLEWNRTGSSYFTYTHLTNIPLRDIMPAQ